MLESLAVASILITLTVAIHMVGLVALMGFLQARSRRIRPFESPLRQGVFIVMIVLGLVVIHGVEIMIYGVSFRLLGVFPTMEAALYYSTSAFTTVGFGDVAIQSEWRLLGALEGLNGFLLIGWSTAFLVAVIGRMRSMEMDWLDRMRDGSD
jgi:uncharacterized protein YhhL (DUF1145 family)